ncbi:hypothetical protein JTB14_026308 [Gonioctena quinquepunctata]|nr:hypothetical protein JTB14_026308 [Gonioctena quinquepunctata]
MVLSMDRWVGKVAVVTGASSGMGASIAKKLVEAGLKVAGLARRKDRLDELQKILSGKPGTFLPVQTDISNEVEILRAFEQIQETLGPISILVNNAAIVKVGVLLTEGETEDWNRILQVNLIGLSVATRGAIKDMRQNNIDGHIININSTAGHQVPRGIGLSSLNMYSPSKFGVTALTEALRLEMNSLGLKIKITSISPGGTATEMYPGATEQTEDFKESKENGEILDPEDVADGVLYVLSTPPHVQVHELTIVAVAEPRE